MIASRSGSEVIARIKFRRLGREDFADLGGQREAKIGVDVHFADAIFLNRHRDLIFGHALGIGHLAVKCRDEGR